ERALGRERLRGQKELHGRWERDLPWQSNRRTSACEQALLRLHDAETRVAGRDADVDASEHLHAACDARPIDGGDAGLVELCVATHGVGAVTQFAAVDLRNFAAADLLREVRDLWDVRLQVRARHEATIDTGDDREPEIVVLTEVTPGLRQV